jgi:hypothetical protein
MANPQSAQGIKIMGLKSAVNALREIGVPDEAIKAAGSRSGEIVAGVARNLVPVRSGRLLNSIRVSKSLRKVSISAGNNTTIPYANPIHWGWFYDSKNIKFRNIKPNPFFVKALGLTRDEVYQNYLKELDGFINRHSTKGTDD